MSLNIVPEDLHEFVSLPLHIHSQTVVVDHANHGNVTSSSIEEVQDEMLLFLEM